MRRTSIAVVAAAAAVAYACGSSGNSPKKDGAVDSTGSAPKDAHVDAKPIDDAPKPLDGPPGTHLLTVKNYSNWCSLQVGSGTFSTGSAQMVFVGSGAVPLAAKPASNIFELGSDMWHHVDGTTGDTGSGGNQTGSGSAATSTAAITIGSADACAWVCCPFTSGAGCDPAVIGDQCP